jgi:hypothetical protein
MITRRGNIVVQGSYIEAPVVTAVANYASLPSTPTLYQICIISTTAVNNVYMTNTTPTSPVTGDLQIGTGYACKQPIYLDSNGRVAAYPTNAYQYNGTAWVPVDLYTWSGTAWVPPWKYLVKYGIDDTSMGGTLTLSPGFKDQYTGYFLFYNNVAGEYRKSNAIDITPYKTLKLRGYMHLATVGYMYIRTVISGPNIASQSFTSTNTTYTLDVSSYTGLMFFGLGINNSAIHVEDWWLE